MVDDRLLTKASTNPENHDRLEQLNIDRLELNRLLLQSADKVPERSKRIEQLEEEIERLEGQLARQISGFERTRAALSVTVAQVQACLPTDAALIEYFLYWRYLGKSKFEPAYGALVLLPKGEPCWIPLDNAGKINKLVSRYSRLRRLNGSEAGEGDVSKNLRCLYDAIWAAVSPHLSGDTKQLIVSPDGQLNFISVATLLTPDDRFLGENYQVQYVASGRDLLQEQKQTAAREVVLFTAPDFDANLATHPAPKDAEAKMRGTETRGLQDLQFQKLEGFQNENEQLLRLFSAWHWPTQSHSGPNATKTALIEVRSPFILHLATHGFFESLGPSDTGSRALSKPSIFESKFFNNPMHQSGLALAGANVTLKLWNRGQEAPSDDGILTAEDAGTMDLQGTWLVTLAACDTAKGQERIGEGVMGLRRGFTKAGVKNLLMTLWEVADQTTTQIMTDFYQAAHKSGNVPQALAEVQRDWLVKLRNEKGLPDAVNLAGPFIMSSQGKP
ncbi:MAG TPA: CHAT domain-containing protein [Candidatus Angelobacter sp.]|jgi:CHAT domain-containing protein|nr:CHAT domain-containing protein [Candidatus Angelobacter sp.]